MTLNFSLGVVLITTKPFNLNQQISKLCHGLGSNQDCLNVLIKKERRRKQLVTKLHCDQEFTFQSRPD